MAIRLYTGKRYKLKAESDDYGLTGAMEIVDGKSTDVMKYVQLNLGDCWLQIDREDLIRMCEFVMRRPAPKEVMYSLPSQRHIIPKKTGDD